MQDGLRKIIHIDMDAFYAAIEQRDNPLYRNKPLIVGGSPDSRGVVATCSYEARRFGVHSAMPSAHAYRLCPQAIFVRPRFPVYQQVSTVIRAIFSRYCDLVEPLSLDEAYLDVSASHLFQGSATRLAKQIKQDILLQTGLIASAGVSYNKFLAKIASDHNKPDGLCVITPEQGLHFVENLPIGRFHGVGKVTEQKMHTLGVFTGKELREQSLQVLQQNFGKSAQYFFDIARGIDHREVNGYRRRKSLGAETTFAEDLGEMDSILMHLNALMQKTFAQLQERGLVAQTLTIKIKYRNFVQITRSKTQAYPFDNGHMLERVLLDLLASADIGDNKVRLLGVVFSGLQEKQQVRYRQIDLFED
jgi:DNA polymerase IV